MIGWCTPRELASRMPKYAGGVFRDLSFALTVHGPFGTGALPMTRSALPIRSNSSPARVETKPPNRS